ncbi:MAG: isoprenylcysteine carboxylmethyltransferase family protein [Nitrosomonas sp.]|nr:isoprenylcysteine carboxylmethyltransferase family protein [Nitrosomonas sp.]MCW5607667.1 isoprenylcysteine carboxylmethyltransferase family protein [Nitrosomonas sp.]
MARSALLIPPVVVLMLCAAVMWYMARYFPFFTLEFELSPAVSLLVAASGLLLILVSSITFYQHNTTLNPLKPELASTLIRTGPYRYSRNPIYGGFVLILLGWGGYLHNLASMLCVILFVLYMNRFQIIPEEKSLEQKFGAEFEAYKRIVNRWL